MASHDEKVFHRLIDRQAIADTFTRYATALEDRHWTALAELFTPDAKAIFPTTGAIAGREAIVALIRRALDRCGPTHHLVGNHHADIDGDAATARCHIRAYHSGSGIHQGAFEESLAIFTADLVRSGDGWLFARLEERIAVVLGTKAIFEAPLVESDSR